MVFPWMQRVSIFIMHLSSCFFNHPLLLSGIILFFRVILDLIRVFCSRFDSLSSLECVELPMSLAILYMSRTVIL